MRAVFFGTPRWAVPSLEALINAGLEVALVVTNADKPAGRGMKTVASPVKEAAVSAGIEVLQPASARDPGLDSRIREVTPDVAVVVAYGRILPGSLLTIPALGFVNVHFSLLPPYRGAAPVQHALLDGLDQTGVSIMVLTEGMDEGPVLATETVDIGAEDTADALGARLAAVGARLLVPTLRQYAGGSLVPQEQDHSRATYAPKVTSEQAQIRWTDPARKIERMVRAFNSEPGAWTTLGGKRLKVGRVRIADEMDLMPAELHFARTLLVGTGDLPVELVEVQPAGKRWMTGEELARGLRPSPALYLE